MNRLEHLLTILIEECAEVQQAATKSLRFGLESDYGSETTNEEDLNCELNQLIAMAEMLQKEGVNLTNDAKIRDAKIEKVEEYLIYSKECGALQED